MKKNFSKYFMIAAVAVTMGCVSSCKDYEDEMVAEFRGEDVALQGSIDNLESDLQKGLADAKAERDALEKKLTDEINTVKELYATKAELEAAKTKLENDLDAAKDQHKADIEALDKKIAGVDADLQATKTKLEDTIGRLTQAETKINTLEGAVAKLQEKDAAIEKSIENLKKTLADEQAAQDAKIKAIEEVTIPAINSEITALKGRADALETKTAAHDKAIEDVNKLIKDLQAEDEELAGLLEDVQDAVKKAQDTANSAVLMAKKVQDDLKAVEKALSDDIAANADDIAANADAIAKNFEAITKNADAITDLENALKAHEAAAVAKMADLSDSLKNAYDAIAANADSIVALDKKLDNAVSTLEDAIEAAEERLQEDIDELKDDLGDLAKRVKANEDAIAELVERMDEVEDTLDDLVDAESKRLTNISLQGAYSPVLGYFNMPMGMKSNVLAAYQGAKLTNTDVLNFPKAYSESVVAGYEPIAQSVWSKLNPETLTIENGEIIGTQNENGKTYAGKVYMVVNPTGVELDDVTFSVVNSLGEEAAVVLDQPVATEDKLSFGYTRAGAALYEATAYVDAEKTNVSLNVADYKDIFSDLKNRQLNVADIVSTLYNTFNNITDANAVSASWTDSLGEHSVMSDYALAAVSVKPLSFNMIQVLENINFNKSISLDKAYAIIDKVSEELKSKFSALPNGFELKSINTDNIQFTINVDLAPHLNGMEVIPAGSLIATIKNPAYNPGVSDPADEYIDIKTTDPIKISGITDKVISVPTTALEQQIKDMIAPINGMIESLEPILGPVNTLLAQLKESEGKFNVAVDKANNVASKLVAGIEKVANGLGSLMNKADNILRPVMLLNTTDGLSVLSQSVNRPVAVANGAVLVPTTYNAELITPIYKKYVAVTKAWDNAGNEVDIVAANNGEGFNEVLEGDVHSVVLNGQSGYKYEITYSALDFEGYVVNTKYYVTVK